MTLIQHARGPRKVKKLVTRGWGFTEEVALVSWLRPLALGRMFVVRQELMGLQTSEMLS